jgi:hypothetical protein
MLPHTEPSQAHCARNCVNTFRPSGQLHKPLALQLDPACSSPLTLLHSMHRKTIPSDNIIFHGQTLQVKVNSHAVLTSSWLSVLCSCNKRNNRTNMCSLAEPITCGPQLRICLSASAISCPRRTRSDSVRDRGSPAAGPGPPAAPPAAAIPPGGRPCMSAAIADA